MRQWGKAASALSGGLAALSLSSIGFAKLITGGNSSRLLRGEGLGGAESAVLKIGPQAGLE